MSLSKVLYSTRVTVTGGRDGEAASADGNLKLKLAGPKELGGPGGATNPEQLFAAGYAACFFSAMHLVAGKKKLTISKNASITGEVALGPLGQGFGIEVSLHISLPGMDANEAKALVEAAHEVCPYSNATRNNIDVTFAITTA